MPHLEQAWRKRHRMRRGHPQAYCRECRAAGKSLAHHCPGRMLTAREEAAITAGLADFRDGFWIATGKA